MPYELTTEDYTRLWPDLVSVAPKKVVFTGGEPLLRRDLTTLLSGFRDADPSNKIRRCLNTNGELLTRAYARKLRGLVDEIRISIDGLALNNDILRGAGSFAQALAAFEAAQEEGFDPFALVTVTKESLQDLTELLGLLFDRRVNRIRLNVFRPIGRGAGRPDWVVPQSEISTMLEQAWHARTGTDLPSPAHANELTANNCGVGRYLNVLPNGETYPCHVLMSPPFFCGDLRQESLGQQICCSDGLLAHLQSLDLDELATAEEIGPLERAFLEKVCVD